jgi:uncharacterized membrane protein SpoIIM required for sporulation
MQSSKYIAERKESWERLRLLVLKIKKKGYRRLTPAEAQDFPNLYRKICTDVETARTLKLAPDMIAYINSIVLQAHSLLYTSPRKTMRRIGAFFGRDYPLAFAKNLKFILIMAVVFFGVGAITFTAVYHHPEYADDIIPGYLKDTFKDAPLRTAADNIAMAGFYIMNNVTIAFGSFLLGVTFGVLTLYLIFYNALVIGAVLGVTAAAGYGDNLFSFIIAHSSLELIGMCIAAGAGLAIGVRLAVAGNEKRSLTFTRKAHEVVPLFIVAGCFITLAAFIEGFISASPVPLPVKIAIAAVSFLGILIYSPLVLWRKLGITIKKNRGIRFRRHRMDAAPFERAPVVEEG